MLVELAYGKKGLNIELSDEWNVYVIEPTHFPGLKQPLGAIREALRTPTAGAPLSCCLHSDTMIGIILNDITRATPSQLLLDVILDECRHVPDENITLFIALGTHRPNTHEELRETLGEKYINRFKIIQNDAFDKTTQIDVGVTQRGHQVWINRALMLCDLKIMTGFIEPHLFAGFSGGGKAMMPGMASLETILANHGAGMIADLGSTWGVTYGNPIWEEIREIVRMVDGGFLLNVTLNKEKEITAVFAGCPDAAHTAGCEFVRQSAMVPVEEPYHIVVTSNSGYPLDLNLYQSVKGMSAAARIIKDGGTIIAVAECWDGIPEHGMYGKLLRDARSPDDLLNTIMQPGFEMQDQWQAQIQAQIQLRSDVYIYSDGLSEQQLSQVLLKKSYHVEDTIKNLLKVYGNRARIAVLPQGPLTVPYIERI